MRNVYNVLYERILPKFPRHGNETALRIFYRRKTCYCASPRNRTVAMEQKISTNKILFKRVFTREYEKCATFLANFVRENIYFSGKSLLFARTARVCGAITYELSQLNNAENTSSPIFQRHSHEHPQTFTLQNGLILTLLDACQATHGINRACPWRKT